MKVEIFENCQNKNGLKGRKWSCLNTPCNQFSLSHLSGVIKIWTSYIFQGAKPDAGRFLNFDHVEWWVGNAKMAAAHYCARFGFDYFAYKVRSRQNNQLLGGTVA